VTGNGLAPVWRVLTWTVFISLPSWIVIGVLAVIEEFPLQAAVIAGAVIYALIVALSYTMLSDFEKLIRYAEHLIEDPGAPPPRIERSKAAGRLSTALASLQKSWADRGDAVAALAMTRKAILDSLPDPLVLIDRSRMLTGGNKAAEDVFGKEIVNGDLATIIRDPQVLAATDQALEDGLGGYVQFSIAKPVERSFGCLIGVLPDSPDEGTAVLLQLHDMTELVKMDRMRADFVANASHELRTPLSSLLGFIETLRGPAKYDEGARDAFLDIMLKQANLMARLIEDLLSLSRIELREHAQPTEAVDVALTVKSTCELLTLEAKDQNTSLNIYTPDSLPFALGENDELGQVFQNLIVNAIKYGGENKPVDISVATRSEGPPGADAGPWLCVSVRDHGEGIAREHIPRLTERFYRVDTARSRELGGTGLGLAIVKHITKRHRGHLVIESTEGQGSVFTVYLPVAKDAEKPGLDQKPQATAA